jgi:hypothetical protein
MRTGHRKVYTCPDCGKPGYPSYEAAEKARRWLKGHSKLRSAYQLETYGPCGRGLYHHTSSKPLGLVTAVT